MMIKQTLWLILTIFCMDNTYACEPYKISPEQKQVAMLYVKSLDSELFKNLQREGYSLSIAGNTIMGPTHLGIDVILSRRDPHQACQFQQYEARVYFKVCSTTVLKPGEYSSAFGESTSRTIKTTNKPDCNKCYWENYDACWETPI